jgi:hypothetical protein
MSTLNVTVKQRKTKTGPTFEGWVDLPGLKSTKLARKDGETSFTTRSALTTVARGVASRYGLTVSYSDTTTKTTTGKTTTGKTTTATYKKAAKKSAKKAAKKPTKKSKTSCKAGSKTSCKKTK